MKLFRARTVVPTLLPPDRLLFDTTPSLFVFAHISLASGYADYRRAAVRLSGIIIDIGFSEGWQQPLPTIANRTHDFSRVPYVYDRFLSIEANQNVRALARIEVWEDHVRDDQMRGDLDYTGFRVSVTMRDQGFRLIQDHLDQLTDEDDDFTIEHSRRLALRIPTKPFDFPPTRGNADPWDSGANAVGRVKRIHSFDVDRIEVTLRNRKPLTAIQSAGPLFDRYAPWLGPTIALQQE